MSRLRERAPCGDRSRSPVPHGHWKTTSFTGALRLSGMTAPMILDGAMNGVAFQAYVQQVLISTLAPGDIIIMDNLPAHKAEDVRHAIEDAGCWLLYLAHIMRSPTGSKPVGETTEVTFVDGVQLFRVSLGLRPWLHRLRCWLPNFVRRFLSYYASVRLLRVVHQRLRLLTFPLRTTPSIIAISILSRKTGSTRRSPGSRAKSFHACQGLRPRRIGRVLAIAHLPMLPSAMTTASASKMRRFRGSMAGLHAPLPTLRRRPHERLRTARGRCGLLLLHRDGLAPSTPCRYLGALSFHPSRKRPR